jgi:predicted nuclease with TOPRIM domain
MDLLQEANTLAKQVLREAPSYLHNVKKENPLQANDIQTSLESMKRRFLADSQDVLTRQRRRSSDINSNVEVHDYQTMLPDPSILGESPHQLSTTGVASNDVLPPIRSQSPSHPSSDGYGTRLPSMKPPPTPGRQLPSPPGRSHASPPSYSMPSPSSTYPPSVISNSAQPPHPSLPNILHPLSPTPSSSLGTSTAIQAHTAALQHEVSVKKYALQTLQVEHDKLLAALRRSQTRARALEEKQVASDLEINTLAEERVRLLTQVQELEQSISDISKSRDEFRQAAVKGGAQYVKIVRMASQLEMMAAEERREWKRKLEENKATIDALQARWAAPRGPDGTSREFETLSSGEAGPADKLKEEVQRLRLRCAEMEAALKDIRIDSQRFGEAVITLSTAGSRISNSVSSILGEPSAAVVTHALQPFPQAEDVQTGPSIENSEV